MSVVGTFESPRKNLARSLAKHAHEEAMNRKRKAPESGLLMRFIGIRLSDLHFFERRRLSSNTICCGKVLHLPRLVDAEQTEGLLVFSSFGIGDSGRAFQRGPRVSPSFPNDLAWISQNPVRCSPEPQFRRANIFYDSPDGLGLFRLPFGRPGPRF